MKYAIPMPHAMRLKAVMQPWEPSVTGRDQQRIATRADQLGYDKIQIPEHLVVPVEHVELSGAHYLHATAAQGFYAGATERIRLSTGITLLALQHPIIMAKALSMPHSKRARFYLAPRSATPVKPPLVTSSARSRPSACPLTPIGFRARRCH